jgi:hypothetical protein
MTSTSEPLAPSRAGPWILAVVSAAAVIALALHGRIPQPHGYNAFADQRPLLGIPNFCDVVSNLAFLAVGVLGVAFVARRTPAGGLVPLRPCYLSFFLAVILVACGSAYYHLAPSDRTLVWDRLPMALAFMSFFAVIVGESISPRLGVRLFIPLLLAGAGSVWYWRLSELAGHGDLRPYILVQYLPIALIPLILLQFPSRLSEPRFIWITLASYAVAKLLEHFDQPVFERTHLVSGHTLKHVVAALGMFAFLIALHRRRRLQGSPDDTASFWRLLLPNRAA